MQPLIVIRASTDPTNLMAPARQAVREAGGDVPFDVKTMQQLGRRRSLNDGSCSGW